MNLQDSDLWPHPPWPQIVPADAGWVVECEGMSFPVIAWIFTVNGDIDVRSPLTGTESASTIGFPLLLHPDGYVGDVDGVVGPGAEIHIRFRPDGFTP